MQRNPQPYARVLRQLKYALKRVKLLNTNKLSIPHRLMSRIGRLISRLCPQQHGPRISKMFQSAALVLGLSTQLQAQVPTYLPAVEDPFGLEGLHQFGVNFKKASFGDIDGDGDLDILFSLGDPFNFQTFLAYCTNVGSAETPFFIAPALGLYGTETITNFFAEKSDYADLDNDGDLDIVTFGVDSSETTRFVFFENIGSSNAPNFAAPQIDPFGIDTDQSFLYLPTYGDLDDDGDLDILAQAFGPGAFTLPFFHYYENTSSGGVTSFQDLAVNPFNLGSPAIYGYHYIMDLVDIDEDGDLDLSAQVEFDDAAPNGFDLNTFGAFENFGSSASAAFAVPDTNLFNIPGLDDNPSLLPFTMVDLDNDGDLDIVATHEYDVTLYYENIQITSSIKATGEEIALRLSPNPSSSIVRIETAEELESVEVFSIDGRPLEQVYLSDLNTVDMSGYLSGIYLLKITTTNDRILMRKVRKQ